MPASPNFEQCFQSTLCRLMIYSPCSFNLLVGMVSTPTDSIDTMGVRVKNGRMDLIYNPKFFNTLEESERTFVLIHEMMHVMLHHCTHRSSNDRRRAYKENVAMDLAVNCLIREAVGIKMPRFKEDIGKNKKGEIMCLLPKMFGFRDNLSFEQYLDLLDQKYPDPTIKFIMKKSDDQDKAKDNEDPGGKGNNQGGSGDIVSISGNGPVEVEIEIDENCEIGKITKNRIDPKHGEGFDEDAFIDDYIRNAIESIERNHLWGNLGGNAIELVKRAQDQPLNWGDILRLKLGPFLSYQKEPTRRRWNRHYGKPFLGQTTKCVEPVAVYADTSGSVGSQDLSRFIVEIERIANYTGVYLWCFDVNIKDPDEYVLFTRRNIDAIEFKGRGGTDFSPIFIHARERNFSQVVVLTDGDAEEIKPEQVEGMDVIWAITKGGNSGGKPGTVIEMK